MEVSLPAPQAPSGGAVYDAPQLRARGPRDMAQADDAIRDAGRVLALFFSRPTNVVGAAILGVVIVLALLHPVLPLSDPFKIDIAMQRKPPSLSHPLGTDNLGRDLLSRILLGSRVSLSVAFAIVAISSIIGLVLGTISGYFGKTVDSLMMAVTDVLLAFPGLLLAIALVAVFGRGAPQLILAACVAAIPRKIRLQRASVLSIKERTYVDAARMAGASHFWIIVRHVLPNSVMPMIVVGTLSAANAILIEASLSFLGLGIVPPQPSWGNIISDGRLFLRDAWWISTFPGLAIVFTAVALSLLGDGIRDHLDPRLQS